MNLWFVQSTTGERIGPGRFRYHHRTNRLHFQGEPVHCLDGIHGLRILDEVAAAWNAERYVPSKTRAVRCAGDLGRKARQAAMRGERQF